MPPTKQYVVLIKAGSRLRTAPDEPLRINFNTGENSGNMIFHTIYVDEGFSSLVPRELWIEAKGNANSLNEAIESFTNTTSTLLAIISFCMNGYAGESQFSIGYEITPNIKKREFFEQFIQDERNLPLPSRKIAPNLILPVIDKLSQHRFNERLLTAIGQYVIALEYWKLGSETLSTAHLFIGMETLVKIVRQLEIEKNHLTTSEELANAWGIQVADLDSKIRQNILFDGDLSTHRDAKKASDGFEHGFLSFNQIRPLAIGVRDKTAYLLRRAIIDILEVPEDIRTQLLSAPYNQPLGVIGYVRYLRGDLIAEREQLAAQDHLHPIMEWRFSVKGFSLVDNIFTISFNQEITPKIGEGVTFSPKSIEIYGPEGLIRLPSDSQPNVIEETNISKNRDDVLKFSEKVWKTVSDYGNNRFLEGSIINVMIFSLFSKCLGQFHSVITLLKQGLTTESYEITWELWKNALFLCQIADTEDRTALVLGIEEQLVNQYRGDSPFYLAQNRLSKLFKRNFRIEKIMKILSQTKRKLMIRNYKKPFSPKISSAKYCSPESYKILSDLSGIGEFSMLQNPNISGGPKKNALKIENHTFDYEDTAILVGLSSEAILSACKSVELILNWKEIDNFTPFMALANELLRTYNTES